MNFVFLSACLSLLGSPLPSCDAFSVHGRASRKAARRYLSTTATEDDNQESNAEIRLLPLEPKDSSSQLSDEELLLACRAYLQKKNRLGQWKEAKERKMKREQQQKLAMGSQSGGFFWDDPSELKYYQQSTTHGDDSLASADATTDFWELDAGGVSRSGNNNGSDNDNGERATQEQQQQLPFSNHMATSLLEQVSFDFKGQSENDHLDEWAREFSTFAAEPSETRVRRCQGAKKRWEDPEWKANWYEKRWGSKKKKATKQSAGSTLSTSQKKSPAFTMEFMNSPEFNSLTEEEISQATTMYVQANAKRAKSFKQTRRQQKEFLEQQNLALLLDDDDNNQQQDAPPIPRDALLSNQNAMMRERHKVRSETAKKAYQTRLQNSLNHNSSMTMTADEERVSQQQTVRPTGDEPKNALKRIEIDLDLERMPLLDDLILISSKGNLGGRKQLMRRLLAERLGLRGKCVPAPTKSDPDNMIFVTNCTVKQLVDFVIAKVKEQQ
ncbi:expressed unknown protein [Seminavis robusta]|uniref:Uncharacterized protein n=1 Tax=Seminavis robusta TaxID=568900 RepID=A0A9N8H8S9_9STRA|nr:expressed unknown protein [Seminavis robusta]|eukprot:Sro250_g099100.1 n/a (497) ;mRNA; r:80155-81645